MNSVAAALTAALAKVKELSSGTLTFVKNGQTLSATVYKSYLKDYNRDMDDAGYSESFDNIHVMATPSDVASWGLVPMTSEVALDGVAYMTGRSITTTGAYTTIWLRIKK